MKARLAIFMKNEGITPSRLAELISVQPSSISHLLAGRNKPGFDFLYKILQRFPRLNPDWLILGSGEMYRDDGTHSVPLQQPTVLSHHYSAVSHTDDTPIPELEFTETDLDEESPASTQKVIKTNDTNINSGNNKASQRKHQHQINSSVLPLSVMNDIQDDSKSIERIVIFFKNRSFKEYIAE